MATTAAADATDHRTSPILRRSARARSTVDGEDPELAALMLSAELPAVSQRAELDEQPVKKQDHFQVGSRVSCAAKCFDSKQGLAKWSRQTFGDGGSTTRIYGTVRERVEDGSGRNRKSSTYRVAWDVDVPKHDPSRAANPNSVGCKLFTRTQLRREKPTAGRRKMANENRPYLDNPVLLQASGEEPAADDAAPKDSIGEKTLGVDLSLTDSEDEAWDPEQDSGGESADEEYIAPTVDRDELLLHIPEQKIDLAPWNGHEVSWHFKGCTQDAMDSAALPWSLAPEQPTGWSPSADPLATCNQTKVKHHPSDGSYRKEIDAFLQFYPGGVDGLFADVAAVNKFGVDNETVNHRWAPIEIFDWLAFLAVLLGGTRFDGHWKLMFTSSEEDFADLFGHPQFKNVITPTRFDHIRGCAHAAFSSDDSRDPWMPFRDFVTRYNRHMLDYCEFGRYWVLDESMSPFQPRADKYGGLPHLSYIQRKPKPFGVEYKHACTPDGLMPFLEIQEGAEPMRDKELDGYNSSASKTARLCVNMKDGMVTIGDSDFGSVPAAWLLAAGMSDAFGTDTKRIGCVLNVKTAHKHFPKEFLETHLIGVGAGTTLVLEATIGGVRMNAIGYKYARSKKPQFFVATVGDFDTNWKPYIARFTDCVGNTVSRPVPRPRVLSVYYAIANRGDVHNQGRQDLIHLESSWPTRNCWFRNFCTGMGMVVENAWRNQKNSQVDHAVTHDIFVRRLSYQLGTINQLVKSNGEIVRRAARATSPTNTPVPDISLRIVSPAGGAAAAALSRPISPKLITFDGEPHQQTWDAKGLNCIWCHRLHRKRRVTQNRCGKCNVPLCSSLTGRDCFKLHAMHGIPPLHVDKKGESERLKWGRIKGEDLNFVKAHANQKGAAKAGLKKRKAADVEK